MRGGALRYDLARDAYGADATRELWRWSERALDRMAELGGEAFRRTGSVRLAGDEQEREAIRAEYEALRADGFDAEWDGDAMVHPRDGSFHPVRFVRRLAVRAAAAGAELREHDCVTSLDDLDAERVLLATDGYGRGLSPELDALVRPVRNQMLVTEPLGRDLYLRPHYARYGHAYWQRLEDGRLLLGGFRDVAPDAEATDEEATTDEVQGALERFLARIGVDAPVAYRWSGIFGVTDDLLPVVGPLVGDRIWVAAGYSGHGNVLGLACGEAVADALLGRAPEPLPALLGPARG